MPSFKNTTATIVTFMALTQLCPAPWVAIAAGAASGAIAGSVSSQIGKRDVTSGDTFHHHSYRRQSAPEGVNQHDYDKCLQDVQSQTDKVIVSNSENGILVENLPPTCMVLAGNFAEVEGAYPVAQGTSSIEYLNVTDAQRDELSALLSG